MLINIGTDQVPTRDLNLRKGEPESHSRTSPDPKPFRIRSKAAFRLSIAFHPLIEA